MKGWTTGALAFMHGISRCQLLWIARSHRTGRCPHGVGNYARSPPDDLTSPARRPRQARPSRGRGTARAGRANASTRPVAPALAFCIRCCWSPLVTSGCENSRGGPVTALIVIAYAIFATVFFCKQSLRRHHCDSLIKPGEIACHETLCLVSLGLTVDEIDVPSLIARHTLAMREGTSISTAVKPKETRQSVS